MCVRKKTEGGKKGQSSTSERRHHVQTFKRILAARLEREKGGTQDHRKKVRKNSWSYEKQDREHNEQSKREKKKGQDDA